MAKFIMYRFDRNSRFVQKPYVMEHFERISRNLHKIAFSMCQCKTNFTLNDSCFYFKPSQVKWNCSVNNLIQIRSVDVEKIADPAVHMYSHITAHNRSSFF